MTDRPSNTNPWPGATEPSAAGADGSLYYDDAPLIAYYGPDEQVAYHPAPAGLTSPAEQGLPPDPGWAALREAVWESGQAPAWGQVGLVPPDTDPAAPEDIETLVPEPEPEPPAPAPARAEAEPRPMAAPSELTPPESEPVAATLTVPVATISGTKTAAHKVVPRPTAAHRISTGRTAADAGSRPSQEPYRIGVGRRMRSGFALILISVVVAGLLTAVLLALVAGIASAISHAASN